MEYRNVGVYMLCRILPDGDAEFFRRNTHARERLYVNSDKKNLTIYMDEVIMGQKSDRMELDRLVEDAVAGKIDHIFITDLADLWHDPQKVFDTIQRLGRLPNPVRVTCFEPNDPWLMREGAVFDMDERLMLKALKIKRIDDELRLISDNADTISPRLRAEIIGRHIDSCMFSNILLDYYQEPRDIDTEEIAKKIGIETDNINDIVDCWYRDSDQFEALVELTWKEIVAYYVA